MVIRKAIPKKSCTDLVKSVKFIEPRLLSDEVRSNIVEQFANFKLSEFVNRQIKSFS